MELLQLKYFCDAARCENFSKTARKFLVPTSNISQSVKRLERELSCELFDHRKNKIVLNANGRRLYESASRALLLLEDAADELKNKGEELSGDIGLICMSNRRIVTAAVERFVKENPRINFTIRHNAGESDFDILISDLCPVEYDERHLLVDEAICVALSSSHPLASREEISLEELKNERFISMTEGSSIRRITVDTCTKAGFTPSTVVQTDDPFYVRKYVEMGMGIALVPECSWRGLFPSSVALVRLGGINRKTYAYLPSDRHVKQATAAFVKVLLEEARG